MEQMEERVRQLFGQSVENKIMIADALSPIIALAAQRLVKCLLNDGKILLCGCGGSAANCQHFSALMINRYEVERPSLPVYSLTADNVVLTSLSNDNHNDEIYARQIQALGNENDVLLGLTTSGNANTIINAHAAAVEKGIDSIILNGRDGGVLANHMGPEDIELRVTANNQASIREIHLFVLHCFGDLIDQSLFGQS